MGQGLVLGRFAPLHQGHQQLIDRALEENDKVLVVVVDVPDQSNVPVPVRSGWIRDLYPTVEVLELWEDGLEIDGFLVVQDREKSALSQLLDGRRVDRFYSGAWGRAAIEDNQILGVAPVVVQPEDLPIASSAIREDPYAYRGYVPPRVYRDLITRVVFLGAPSTGKSTLAQELARRYRTVWMPEYGREYWLNHQQDRRLSQEQLVEIAEGHIEREEPLLLEANEFLFVDTDATTTYMFALDYYGEAHPRLEVLADQARDRYDLFFFCGDEIPYEDTWERSGAVYRKIFQRQTRADLERRKVQFIDLVGSVDERLETAERILRGFRRYGSIGEQLSAPTSRRVGT